MVKKIDWERGYQKLRKQLSIEKTKNSLEDKKEFKYRLLVSLEQIRTELNSISLQLYDRNKIKSPEEEDEEEQEDEDLEEDDLEEDEELEKEVEDDE